MSIDPIIEQLKKAREEAGESPRQIAAWAGINAATLCEAEAGKHATTLPKLRRWARALGLDLALVEARYVGPGSTSPEPGPATGGAIGCWPPLLDGAVLLTERGPAAVDRPLPWPDFNPAYRVVRCGQGSAHGPHFMDHGPDQPRNCPGTGDAAWSAYQRWAESTKDGTDG